MSDFDHYSPVPMVPLIKHYRDGGVIVRSTNMQVDVLYMAGDLPANYPVPADIGYVSFGADMCDVVYIDSADEESPEMVWFFDARGELCV